MTIPCARAFTHLYHFVSYILKVFCTIFKDSLRCSQAGQALPFSFCPSLSIYTCIYIYVYIHISIEFLHMHMHMYVYIYRERDKYYIYIYILERERERERETSLVDPEGLL